VKSWTKNKVIKQSFDVYKYGSVPDGHNINDPMKVGLVANDKKSPMPSLKSGIIQFVVKKIMIE
jgi:hypothetical protein